MQGLLLIDKPANWTSFDAVNYIRRVVAKIEAKKPKNCKVGHTGTLDPFATGLLLLLVGKEYTRQASDLTKVDKTYEMTMRLGQTSTTGDPEGEITISSMVRPNQLEIELALCPFIGLIQQVPPAYSAIKIDGQRAYKLARAGQEVVIPARPVTIHSLELLSYEYPNVALRANVSSGTYIRTLVADIGAALGCGAYTTQLRRTGVANYNISDAVEISALSTENLEKLLITIDQKPPAVEELH